MIENFDPYRLTDEELISYSLMIEDTCKEDVKDIFEGMTPYQIEHFVLGKIPPIGRYHQCCLEIRRRLDVMKGTREALTKALESSDEYQISEKREVLRVLESEIVCFRKIADRYAHLTEGKRFDHPDIQEQYWDQHFGWKLAISLVSGNLSADLIQSIMCLHASSSTRLFMQKALHILANEENEAARSQIQESVSIFIEEYRCVENVKRPRLPAW